MTVVAMMFLMLADLNFNNPGPSTRPDHRTCDPELQEPPRLILKTQEEAEGSPKVSGQGGPRGAASLAEPLEPVPEDDF